MGVNLEESREISVKIPYFFFVYSKKSCKQGANALHVLAKKKNYENFPWIFEGETRYSNMQYLASETFLWALLTSPEFHSMTRLDPRFQVEILGQRNACHFIILKATYAGAQWRYMVNGGGRLEGYMFSRPDFCC